ncbi:hypothetical protein ACJJVG_08795 [Pseudocitrobacter faecalis]|uniref:hypothetical protein n=1 Tax=Pseudocitrobacter faecalis TaxID=1398493 RepID=UPI00389A08C6
MKQCKYFEENTVGVLVSDKYPDLVEPVAAIRNSGKSVVKVNRKQFGQYIRFVFSNTELWEVNLKVYVEGDVTEWRTYSKEITSTPEFLKVLPQVKVDGQWFYQPEAGKVTNQVNLEDWIGSMIRYGAHLGNTVTITGNAMRAKAPSVYGLAELLGAKVHYTGKCRDAQITGYKEVA